MNFTVDKEFLEKIKFKSRITVDCPVYSPQDINSINKIVIDINKSIADSKIEECNMAANSLPKNSLAKSNIF